MSAGSVVAADELLPEGLGPMFETQAALTPNAIAVVRGRESLTYRELNRQANQLAHYLIALGVQPETLVALCVGRSPRMLVALLAILKAGGTYVPIDPATPPERARAMLRGAHAAVLVTESQLRARLEGHCPRVIDLDGDAASVVQRPAYDPSPALRAANLAYCIFTSGSTGQPKGVAVPVSNLVHHALQIRQALAIRPSDRVLQFTPMGVDASLEEIFPAWLGGAAVVLPPERVPSTSELLHLIDDQEISILSLPTSYWHQWVDDLAARATSKPRALRVVFVGGERILADKLRRWHALPWSREVEWIADYGPTETTISCATYSGMPDASWTNVPIGRAIAGTSIYVLDDDLEPVPSGVTGELYIAGAGVARGYLGRSALTAERFLPDPFGAPGTRMYRSGDRGYVLPDGAIQFVGRTDHQVKIRGYRVELGEVEAALRSCDGVREAVVVAEEVKPGDVRLIAHLSARAFDERAIRARLAELLPAAMIPAELVHTDALTVSPVTAKVDRRRVREAGAPAASPLEAALGDLFGEIAGRAPRSGDEDFFFCGGDSLRALRLLAWVEAATGIEVKASEFLKAPDVASLARLLENAGANPTDLADRLRGHRAAPALRGVNGARCRASDSQQRLWFLHKLQGGTAAYSIPLGYRIRGAFSPERFDRALTRVVARHDALRTALTEDDGVLWQEVAEPLPVHSRHIAASDFEEALRIARNEAAVPFDLTRAPLLRSTCIRIGENDTLLLLNVHHSVFDAWSLAIFWRELGRWYADGDDSALPAQDFQFADYSEWQREWLSGAAAERQRTFWREALDGELPILRLDRGAHIPSARSTRGAIEPLRVADGVRRAVGELARARGTTEFVVLLAAFAATLYRYTRQDQLVVGVPAACRTLPETESVIGYFANTLPLRLFIAPERSFAELVDATSRTLSAAMTHQELPFNRIVDALAVQRHSDSNPLFQAMFVMQTTPMDEALRLEGLAIEEVAVHSGTAKVDLTCALRAAGGGFEGELEYASDVLGQEAAHGWANGYLELLIDATRRPATPIEELRMLAPEDGKAIVERANARFEVYPDLQPLHAAFEMQARAHPDAIAVEARSESIRYGELNVRANRLAVALIAAGAKRGGRIGICLDRSIDAVVALLATLKSGAAFVPLDPTLPVERIRAVTSDAGPLRIVTQERYASMLGDVGVPLLIESRGGGDAANPGTDVSLDDVAYIYYTSGSTGAPKGVILEHRCAMNRLEWLLRRYALGIGDRVLHKTPLIFDVAIWEIFGPLSRGATILMADAGAEADVRHIASLLAAERMRFAHFVPSMLDAYLTFAPRVPHPDLRWVQLSGEAVPSSLLERFRDHFSAEFHNMYGQTETSEVAAWEGRALEGRIGVPIGRQIGIYRLYVLDAALHPVPPGVPGELCVAGLGGLARGYHARPELTAEKFVPNPYAVEPGERLYRTGDIVRWSDGGLLEYLGRVDEQTKIRGCRVETAEVEAVLARHPAIAACAVVVRRDDGGNNELAAYVAGDRGACGDIGAHVERILPRYMHPAVYVFLDALPLTPSGKLDRLRLPAPTAADRALRTTADDGPRTPLEHELAALWKQVLGLDRLGRSDNFFAVGGNSLKCIQVLTRVNAAFDVEVSVREFFATPTLAGLAQAIEAALVAMVTSLTDDDARRRIEELGA